MSHGEDLAKQFEALNAGLIGAVEACSDAAWNSTSEAEGWTAAALAHHIAVSHEGICGMVGAVATGQALPPMTPADLDTGNAAHAKEFAACDKAEVVTLAKAGGAVVVGALRGLSDDQLTGATAEFFGNNWNAKQIAENILIGHVQMHLPSFKATTGQ